MKTTTTQDKRNGCVRFWKVRRRGTAMMVVTAMALALSLTAVATQPASASVQYLAVGDGLALRAGPGTQYPVLQRVNNGTPLDIACQVQGGTNIGGNATWDKLTNGEWVADYYTTSPSFNSYAPGLGDCNAVSAPPNQQIQAITSSNGSFTFVMQSDGNLVLYAQGGVALWASGTYGHPGSTAWMQGDGNLVVYSPTGNALWSSGTYGHPGSRLDVQNDGNVVIHSPAGAALWSTGTWTHHYHIELKAWIPQPWVADPWDPALNPLTVLNTPDFPCSGLFTSSRFQGDNYVPFDGGSTARGDRTVDFDWNGSRILNFKTTVVLGVSHRWIAYSNIVSQGSCVVARTATDSGFAYPTSASTVSMAIQTSNPLVPGAPAIHAVMNVAVLANGTLNIGYQTTFFPSIGFKVTRDGQASMSDIVNDASCASNDKVLGPSGLAWLPILLLDFNNTGTASIVPNATGQAAQRDGYPLFC